jgi:hypothetical protein
MKAIFSQEHRSMFKRQFGLDVWYSFVHAAPDSNRRTGWPRATIAYLTLPDSTKRQHSWSENGGRMIDTAFVGENGFGMAVEVGTPPSADQLDKFPLAMKYLN